MRINFKKVSAIAASALMVGMTMGTAVAANYPAPFVAGGSSSVAVVYGTGAGVSSLDLIQAGNIQSNLQSYMTGSSSTSTSVTGEAIELYTGGTKLYIADTVNKVKSVLTKSDLPTVLADGSFSGNVDATYTQTMEVGAYPNITFEKQPTSSDDPNLAVKLSTSTNNAAFNLTASFSKTLNFSHADSEGEEISLFGQDFTVGSATDATNLVLLQSAEKLDLSSDTPAMDATIAGKDYSFELVSASDTSATIKVTDKATGVSASKEINEAATKKINGVTVAVQTADETNLRLTASIVAGSEKITLTDSSYVTVGESDTAILGTDVDFHGGNPGALSKMTISVAAEDSDKDAIKSGGSLIDPVFKAVKMSLGGFNIDIDSSARENIVVQNNGDNKMEVKFTDYLGNEKTVRYYYGLGAGGNSTLYATDDYNTISVRERESLNRDDYVVVGNEDEGHLIRVSSLYRSWSGWGSDKLSFSDVMTGGTVDVTFSSNTSVGSTGSMVVGGKTYTVYLQGTPGIDYASYNVSIDYPDSATTKAIVWPTIQTSKGAKLMFYQPLNISVGKWALNASGDFNGAANISGIMVPNGADTYQTITLNASEAMTAPNVGAIGTNLSVTCGLTTVVLGSANQNSTNCAITSTGFSVNITSGGIDGSVYLKLLDVAGTNSLYNPAIILYEEKDDNNNYEGLIVKTELGGSGDDGAGVDDVERTWTDDAMWDSTSMASDSKKEQEIDLWGTLITTDKGDSDQAKVTISYPDEQVYALVYLGQEASSVGVSGISSGSQLGDVIVKDSEVSSVSSKNLIVVGGSCVNSVAAHLLGSTCGASFTEKTGVGSGQFLIQSFGDAYTSGKIALVVAGYEAVETGYAATYLRTKTVDTTAGKKYRGTSATVAELVTTSE